MPRSRSYRSAITLRETPECSGVPAGLSPEIGTHEWTSGYDAQTLGASCRNAGFHQLCANPATAK
jgi:hypothetical protein